MKIFNSEKEIKDLILANRQSEFYNASLSKIDNIPDSYRKSISRISEDLESSGNVILAEEIKNRSNDHLYFGKAIMCSTSMNRNDDVFLSEEVWKARFTPIDTPYNKKHKKKDIVGHIIGVNIIDESGNKVDMESEDIPDYFDIEAEFVVYSHIFPEFIEHLEKNAEDQKTMVSLEAISDGFNYALFEGDDVVNPKYVVERNEETAFLSKYLRLFKGDGYYNGYRIGRVPIDFNFVGMGDVENGANPDSYYTSLNGKNFDIINNVNSMCCINNIEEQNREIYLITSGIKNMKKFETLEDAVAHIEELQAQIDSQENQDKEDQTQAMQEKIDAADAKIESLESELNKAKEDKDAVDAELSELKDEIEAQKAAAIGESRVSELESLGRKFDDREAKVDFYAKLEDAAYQEIKAYAESTKVESASDDTEDSQDDASDKEIDAALETEESDEQVEELDDNSELEASTSEVIAKALTTVKGNK